MLIIKCQLLVILDQINKQWKKIKSEKTEDLIKEYIKTLHDEAVPTITHSFRSIFSSTRNTATNSISPSSFSVNQYLSIDNQVSANATEQKNALLKINNKKTTMITCQGNACLYICNLNIIIQNRQNFIIASSNKY